MDYFLYDQPTKELINNCEQLTISGDIKALSVLKKLKNIAENNNDNSLMGFVYFYYANWYYDSLEYEKFQNSLEKAIHYLLRSNEYELLARSYNFFAIDAQNNDAYDVAYSYYMSALRFINNKEDSYVSGVITVNLANYYLEIGDYKTARKYFRQGIKYIEKNTNDPFYYHNLMATIVNDGLNSLNMNDIKSAQKAFDKAKEVYKKLEDTQFHNVMNSFRFFEIRLALKKNNIKKKKKQTKNIIQLLKDEQDPLSYVEDISDFCHALLENKQLKAVGEMIGIVNDKVMSSDLMIAKRLLVEIKIDYYQRIKDENNLIKALKEQNGIIIKQRKEREKIYHYSTKLISLVGKLQEEEIQVKQENEDLHIQILTDPLTNIHNRHSFDIEVYNAFERSYQNKTNLGIEILDIDDFKDFNDNYGHNVGDLCLIKIGEILGKISKEEDVFVGRYGGDEFVVIYENKKDKDIKRIVKLIENAVEKSEIVVKGKKLKQHFHISQGICNDIPRLKSKPWDFLAEADNALYSIKNKKNRKTRIAFRKLTEFQEKVHD